MSAQTYAEQWSIERAQVAAKYAGRNPWDSAVPLPARDLINFIRVFGGGVGVLGLFLIVGAMLSLF